MISAEPPHAQRRAFSATVGSGVDLIARQAAQFLVLLILARLLTPADFGTVALLAVFVAIGVVIADAGLSTALLQAETVSKRQVDSAYWTSVALGVALTVAAVLIAKPTTILVGRPDLFGVAALMTLTILATAVGQIPTVMLVRDRAFGRLLAVGVSATLASGAVSIPLATAGAGLWALAAQSVALPAFSAGLVIVAARSWRPTLAWNRQEAAALARRGRWVLAANLVDQAYLRTQTLVTGLAFGAAGLGTYQRADSTQQLTTETTSAVVGRVALPLFAQSTGRPDLLRVGFLTGIRSVNAVNAPTMAVLASLSTPILAVFFGEQWRDAGPLLTILSIAGLMWPLHVMSISVLYADGKNRQVFSIDLVKKAAGLVLLAVGVSFGLSGVAWAQVGLGVVAVVVNAHALRRAIAVGIGDQLRAVAPVVALATVVALGTAATSSWWQTSDMMRVVVLVPSALVGYLLLAIALRLRAVTDLLGILRSTIAHHSQQRGTDGS